MALKRRAGPSVPMMNDVQLLAHLIHLTGTDLTSARELSHVILNDHKELRQVLFLPFETLMAYPQLGENAASFLCLLGAVIEHYINSPNSPVLEVEDQSVLSDVILPHFYDPEVEHLCVFLMDEEGRLLSGATVARGNEAAVSCPIRRVVQLATAHRAKRVLLVHNHPDGTPSFSKTDLDATYILAQSLAPAGICLWDHFLLAGDETLSLRQWATALWQGKHCIPLLRLWFPVPFHFWRKKPRTT